MFAGQVPAPAIGNHKRSLGIGLPFRVGQPGLGHLEARVIERLWDQKTAVSVRQLHDAFPELAYTTVMTTLDRLYRKGLLVRRRRGRAFVYEPRCSRDELLSEMMSGHVTHLLEATGASGALLSTLVRAVSSSDAALLDELDALVRAERRRLTMETK